MTKILRGIFKNLYYPDSPFEFSVIPTEILGEVYEQFLGKVIRITGKRAVVEEKPEVKKAGGVYYTPKYIVDYIVENTVGKMLKDKKPGKAVDKIKILDPACGSGSFLLGAYQYLLNWYRNQYEEAGPQKNRKVLYEAGANVWRLTTDERKRILLTHIYGVDIDLQAVEVTKLSLLLKVLEGESGEILRRQMEIFKKRVLPDLGDNIKCGNSLIGSDFYQGQQVDLLNEEELYRVNAFDWNTEFKEIMKSGGFDAVIGNPPYGYHFSKEELTYLKENYLSIKLFPDSYCIFMLKSSLVLKNNGLFSMIVPNTFCDLENCEEFRNLFLTKIKLTTIWQTGMAFKSAVVDTLVFIAKNTESDDQEIEILIEQKSYKRKLKEFKKNQLVKINYRLSSSEHKILQKIGSKFAQFKDFATIQAGVKLYEKGKGTPPQTVQTLEDKPFTTKDTPPPKGWRVLYRGASISRYKIKKAEEFVNYGEWLAAPRNNDLFNAPKILMRRTDDQLMSTLDTTTSICVNSCHVIKLKDDSLDKLNYEYVIGLLNSKFLQLIFELDNPQMVNKAFAEIKIVYVERLPIKLIDFTNPEEKSRHDNIVKHVKTMLELNRKLDYAKTAEDKTYLQRQIAFTDQMIDQHVYQLYKLTDDEIEIVKELT